MKQRDDIWCIEIIKAKTAASERIVPLHQTIIEQGFTDFVKTRDGERLFGEKGTSKEGLIKRLRRWLHSIDNLNLGHTQGLAPNHAWRHWIKRAATDVGIEDRTIDAIVGHAPATVGAKYGGVSLLAMKTALDKIPVPRAKPG